jgi:hypothetical protein
MAEDHIEVYEGLDSEDAHFLRNLLADAGIEAIVVGDAAEGAVGERSPFSSPPQVWVPPTDVDRARPIVAEYQRHLIERTESSVAESEAAAEQAESEPFCYHCGNPVNAGQTPCPVCGQPLEWPTA